MSHVISAQPSATSPYQPTAVQEGNGATNNTPRIHRIDSEQGQDDCCLNPRGRKGCCKLCCTPLFMCYSVLAACTESCCDCCADCLNDCCEDKPRDRNERIYYNNRYKKSGGTYFDNATDNDWGLTSLAVSNMHSGLSEPDQGLMSNTSDDHQESGTQHLSDHHNSRHHSSSAHHDSGTHHSSNYHDSGTHHSSSHHDSGTHHSSSHHDTCHSSGGGFDSGAGDSGGGCDSGGGDTGGCDSGGGGCDD